MRFIFIALVLAVVGCSKSSDTSSSSNADGCTTGAPTAGKAVYHSGSSYDKFESGKTYVGKVLAVLADGYAEIDWGSFKSVEYQGNVKFEATCTPTPVGKRAYHSGSSYGNFESGKQYSGTVLAAFNDGYYQVTWDAGFSSVEYKGNVKIEQ